jgi:hypothetical protein
VIRLTTHDSQLTTVQGYLGIALGWLGAPRARPGSAGAKPPGSGQTVISPRRMARRTASVRLVAGSLPQIEDTWNFTV